MKTQSIPQVVVEANLELAVLVKGGRRKRLKLRYFEIQGVGDFPEVDANSCLRSRNEFLCARIHCLRSSHSRRLNSRICNQFSGAGSWPPCELVSGSVVVVPV